MEALACGIPVVATKIWGIPEIITDETYGILIDKQNPNCIFEGLNTALNREWDSEKILNYSRKFNWYDVAKNVEKQLKLII